MASERPSTPPAPAHEPGTIPKAPLTPDQLRRIELNRLKAKARREQLEADDRKNNTQAGSSASTSAGQKRPYAALVESTRGGDTPATLRDGRGVSGGAGARPLDEIRPARNFARYVEYDFSKMTDTKGGFLSVEDDPFNKALHAGSSGANEDDQKPANMTLKEWEKQRLMKSLREAKQGPFEPGISALDKDNAQRKCRECGSLEIDFKWLEVLRCAVCQGCKDKFPERYSLLTKTEARDDYLLTDHTHETIAELKDEELLPHLERPNPHKSTWNNMMLYLRYQVEEYAFSSEKWGSPDALDAEFERRENEKKRRKEVKFKSKLNDLKKRTRVDAYRRNRQAGAGAGGQFGDDLGNGRHVHQWGRLVENEDGIGVKTCTGCGMEVEELEF